MRRKIFLQRVNAVSLRVGTGHTQSTTAFKVVIGSEGCHASSRVEARVVRRHVSDTRADGRTTRSSVGRRVWRRASNDHGSGQKNKRKTTTHTKFNASMTRGVGGGVARTCCSLRHTASLRASVCFGRPMCGGPLRAVTFAGPSTFFPFFPLPAPLDVVLPRGVAAQRVDTSAAMNTRTPLGVPTAHIKTASKQEKKPRNAPKTRSGPPAPTRGAM